MGKGGEKGRRGRLTREQRAEKFSTGSLDFEESLRRVLAGGPDDEHKKGGTTVGDVVEHELTDEELVKRMADAQARLRDGSAKVFYDDKSLVEYWENRRQD